MKIYGDTKSGNCLKVKWVCDRLALPYSWIAVDTLKRESRTPQFLKLNGAGQVPVVEFDDGRSLAQSNAIIRHLARDSDLIPTDAFAAAKMDEWLFWEQYSHEPYIAVCRFQYAHGFAFISDLGARNLAMGYLALVIPDPTSSANGRLATPGTCGGANSTIGPFVGCVSTGEALHE